MAIKAAEFGEFLVGAPLYRSEIVEGARIIPTLPQGKPTFKTPETVRRDCERCQLTLTWDRESGNTKARALERSGTVAGTARGVLESLFDSR